MSEMRSFKLSLIQRKRLTLSHACDSTSLVPIGTRTPGSGIGNCRQRAARVSACPERCFRHQMLLRGYGQWYRCGRDRVAGPSEQENLDPRPEKNRRRQEDVSKSEPSHGQTGLHSRSSDLTSELQSSVRSDEVVIATEQLQVLIEPIVSKNTNEPKTCAPGRFGLEVSRLGWQWDLE